MVGRSQVSFEVLRQWIGVLRQVHWPGPTLVMPEIYAAGHWTGVCPLRNLLTYRALQDKGWDYLFWIDADHKVQPGLFDRVQQHAQAEVGIVCGPYFGRSWPFEIQAFVPHASGGHTYPAPSIVIPLLRHQQPRDAEGRVLDVGAMTYAPGAWPLLPISGGGTGCMLIRRDVLEGLAALRGAPDVWRVDRVPWSETVKLLDAGQDVSGVMTEDVLFCLDAKQELGVQTWLDLDPRMETGHVGEMTVDRRTYMAAHELQVPEAAQDGLRAQLARKGYELASPPG